jgi:hypothetical protein
MSWADQAKAALRRGETTQIRPRGHSMTGRVNDGALVTLSPCDPDKLQVGDVVLVRVKGSDYLHLIKEVKRGGQHKGLEIATQFLIGNNRGGINGWVKAEAIYGRATHIENG